MEDSIYTCEKNHVFIEENSPWAGLLQWGGHYMVLGWIALEPLWGEFTWASVRRLWLWKS